MTADEHAPCVLVQYRHLGFIVLGQDPVDELRCSRKEWHTSHTRTGRGYEGNASSLLEQLLQQMSPQFLQWCCRHRTHPNTNQFQFLHLCVQVFWPNCCTFRLQLCDFYSMCKICSGTDPSYCILLHLFTNIDILSNLTVL